MWATIWSSLLAVIAFVVVLCIYAGWRRLSKRFYRQPVKSRNNAEKAIEPPGDEVQPIAPVERPKLSADRTVLFVGDQVVGEQDFPPDLPGFSTVAARDGRAGLVMASQYLPDVVLLSLPLTDFEPLSWIRKLRSDILTCHIPVLLLHGSDKFADVPDAVSSLSRSTSAEGLLREVEALLSVSRLQAGHAQRALANAADVQKADESSAAGDVEEEPSTIPQDQFVERLSEVLAQHYRRAGFGVDQLADAMHTSRRQLYRKMKATVQMTPRQAIRNYRLEAAALLLKEGISPKRVCYETGFSSPSYFGACFKTKFGCQPGAYRRQYAPGGRIRICRSE